MANRQETLRLLREEARQLVASRRYAPAIEVFAKLEALQPADAEWPKRAADCYAALKKPKEQAEALARAAERFEKARVLKKAEALCKVALGLDASNARARALLTELDGLHEQTRRATIAPRPATIAPRPATIAPEPLRAAERDRALTRRRLDQALRDRRASIAAAGPKK
jgi:tetratricopeptide (TPR) repeat protein